MTNFLDTPDDLSNLKLIDKKLVEEFLSKLNAYNGDKKLVAAIGTGGTISMKIENSVRVPDLDFNSIFKHVGHNLENDFYIISLDTFCVDSTQMNYSHIHDLTIVMAYIWNNIKSPFLGFLITHGTDTMSYSASTLSLMMGQGLPFSVVYTGAQKPIQEKMSDAGQNLTHALYTLDSLNQKNMAEIVVVIGDKAILGTSSMKTHNALADGFDSPIHHYVANFSTLCYPIKLASWLKPKRNISFFPTVLTYDYSQTLIIHSTLGLCPEQISRQVEDPQVKAIVIFSYPSGVISKKLTDIIIISADKNNIPIFIMSPVHAEYKTTYKPAKDLIDQGVTPLYMTLPTALAKIEIALGFHEGNKEKIADFMTTNYVGEIPSEQSRFYPIIER